jgi:hypothetical protein
VYRFDKSMLRILILLAIAGAAWADLSVVDDKLALDAMVRPGVHWWRGEQAGLAQSEFAFERLEARAGLTVRLSSAISFRASGDVSILQPQDLYVDLHWRSGFGLRAGQFLLPLGMDAMTEPDSQVLAGSSFLVSYAKPSGIRDIGLMGGWEISRFSAAVAVVNGRGPNASDDNARKDLCGRIVVRPLATLGLDLALRVYYGWPNAPDSVWRSAAFEARLNRGPLTLQTELQNHLSQYARNNMAYLQMAWEAGILDPVGRFDLILRDRERPEWMMTGGLNAAPLSDRFRVMFDCSYHRDYQGNWAVFGFGLRLQTVL